MVSGIHTHEVVHGRLVAVDGSDQVPQLAGAGSSTTSWQVTTRVKLGQTTV